MRILLTARPEPSALLRVIAPVLAFLAALAAGAAIVAALGKSPLQAFDIYFTQTFTDPWVFQQVLMKATPLVIIAIGLSFCFRANRWNIGAEGQYLFGILFGSWLAIGTAGSAFSPGFIVPVCLLAMLGGALYAGLAAFLKNRLGVNEILSTLMLVYVAQNLMDFMVRGPWRDPASVGFPQSITFDHIALPRISTELFASTLIAVFVVLIAWFVLTKTRFGFAVSATGEAPKAATFAGFNDKTITLCVLMISGALAGLAGMLEVIGPIGRLNDKLSLGYGFTAIIVAFLGRLSPVGIVLAGFAIALTLVGNENAQIMMRLPLDFGRVLQGLLLLFVLAGDTLTRYRLVIVPAEREAAR
jgi:general nucleoside transport system permease protein